MLAHLKYTSSFEQKYSPISELIHYQPRDDHGFLNCTFQIQISFLHVPNSEYK